MKVELFEIEDEIQLTEQLEAEAIELCQQLGLKGQLHKENDTQTTIRCPYRLMTDEELFVYKAICPETSTPEDYSNDAIPLQVLKTLAYAKSLNLFQAFQIWSASSVKVKDPILVAYPGDIWSGKIHILARWGAELLPLGVLLLDAIKLKWAERCDALREIQNQVKHLLELQQPASHKPIKVPTSYA